ncbi:MAG: hypothetical protein H6907_15330 [Hyphomicrobiales bacterium]|nr:hypothetical protein [Hyphomicrobiales bacterium]MCP5373097.1 hypothetical protein [Hyphomicrobiales bacterium]
MSAPRRIGAATENGRIGPGIPAPAGTLHDCLPGGPFVCQDIAITGNRPVIPVVNHVRGINVVQKPFARKPGSTRFPDLALAAMAEVRP